MAGVKSGQDRPAGERELGDEDVRREPAERTRKGFRSVTARGDTEASNNSAPLTIDVADQDGAP
jgi:hypothetical protein